MPARQDEADKRSVGSETAWSLSEEKPAWPAFLSERRNQDLAKRRMPFSQLTRMTSFGAEPAFQNGLGQGFSICCWMARFRAGRRRRVEAGLGQFGQGAVVDQQTHFQLGQAFFQVTELDPGDAGDVMLVQGVETTTSSMRLTNSGRK